MASVAEIDFRNFVHRGRVRIKHRLLVLSRYGPLGASTRLRMLQYLPHLAEDWDIVVSPLLGDGYLSELYAGRLSLSEVMRGYARRLNALRQRARFDLTWLQAELLPWTPWLVENALSGAGSVYVADYDDALFHRYDGNAWRGVRALLLGKKIASVMRHARIVAAGNDYIAAYAREAGARRVELIPTAVDLERYSYRPRGPSERPAIGWIGTPKTEHYLRIVDAPLRLAQRELGAHVIAIGADPGILPGLSAEARAWSAQTEGQELSEIDIGIMPLPDEPFERGKCAYKLIQYMAAGKPVIASPVGVNRQIVRNGVNGFLASSPEEWIEALRFLVHNPSRAAEMGAAGRRLVETSFSTAVVAPRLSRILEEAIR